MKAAEMFLAAMETVAAELDEARAQRDVALNHVKLLVDRLQEMDEDIRAKEWLAARLYALEEVCRGCRRNLCGCPANRMIASSAAASVLREVEGAD